MAKLLNKVLKGKADDEQIKALTSKYKRPGNVDFLQVPKVDTPDGTGYVIFGFYPFDQGFGEHHRRKKSGIEGTTG